MSLEDDQKDEAYGELARIGKAIASPGRLRLLETLCQKPSSVEELAEHTSMSVANTSQHLKVLRTARLVRARVEGARRVYHLADPDVAVFFAQLSRLGRSQLPAVGRIASEQDPEPLDASINAVLDRLRQGECQLLDVRPEAEYEAGHLPGARSIPIHELESRIGELDRTIPVVTYCRGPHCTYAARAVRILRANGFMADRLEAGPAEALEAGLSLESSREDKRY